MSKYIFFLPQEHNTRLESKISLMTEEVSKLRELYLSMKESGIA